MHTIIDRVIFGGGGGRCPIVSISWYSSPTPSAGLAPLHMVEGRSKRPHAPGTRKDRNSGRGTIKYKIVVFLQVVMRCCGDRGVADVG